MKGLRYLVVITKRRFAQAYLDFFDENGVDCVFVQQCIGSANDKILEYMSLEHSEKIMFSAFVPTGELPALKKGMLSDLHLSGIGGRTALGYFIGDKELSEEQNMEENKFCLIVTIVNQGFADVVMDAAREVNARGGTILKAKGTGAGYTQKFFGISITEEKEMVYIVARKEDRDGIMHAIMDKAGAKTDARGAVFALPVDSVAGVQSLLSTNEEE